MYDFSQHLILLYFISFLSGFACISIFFVICKKEKTPLLNHMRDFNVAFFIYILIGFADFYRSFFFLRWEMNVLLMLMYNMGLIIFTYYWLNYAQEFIEVSKKKWIKLIIVEGSISLAAWIPVYLYYMDQEYNLYSAAGKMLGFLPDTIFYITLFAVGIYDIVFTSKNRNLDKQNRNYFIVANVMILTNLCWGYLTDLVLIFYPFGEQISWMYPFNPAILIYLMFNIWTIKYLYGNNFFIPSSDWISDSSINNTGIGLYNIDEIAGRFNLTKRETELVQLVFKGYSNPEISKLLNITTGTVKRHIQNVYKKMDVKNRYELIYLIKSE